ncbi:MAG: MarR family transcriptional regulator, partial [Oscillospiraceae bacterium]|nr:MarR family transcriptional regulator [Oscillospiraceae bacterium]
DGRVIRVTLTRVGRKLFMLHMHFHMVMIKQLEEGLADDEKSALVRVITKLDSYFEKSIEASK